MCLGSQLGNQGQYLEHLIFFVTYEWAQEGSVLHYTGPERLDKDKQSTLSGPFVSYGENEVL